MPPCNRSCAGSCDETLFAPVCTAGGDTHFSACHLGCAAVNTTKGGEGALGGTVQVGVLVAPGTQGTLGGTV